jgi:hypothetical protein
MQKIKDRWEISRSWQLLFPILGAVLVFLTAFLFSRRLILLFELNNSFLEWTFIIFLASIGYFLGIKFFLWCFKKLENKWVVGQKWELIAIFIVFAITGSVSAKLAKPLLDIIGLHQENTSGWFFWPLRILIILPIYQLLLVIFGWLFGQFKFFWNFEKKMLRRMGLGFLFN